MAIVHARLQLDFARRSVVFNGVGEEVIDDLAEALLVACHESRRKLTTNLAHALYRFRTGMNGVELTRRIRADEKTGHALIVLLTGCKKQEALLRCLEAGTDCFYSNLFVRRKCWLVCVRISA